MRIQHNIMALNANRNLNGNNNQVSKSLEKLSSGYRINRAGDDAAGLAISEKMRAQISCLTQAETNCNDGISLIQTAEGALTEVHDMLNRMVELAEQSANGTYTNETDRKNLQSEVSQLKKEIDRIADSTNFNGIKLLDGSLGSASSVKGTMGATAVEFSTASKIADLGTAHTVTLAVDKTAAEGITVGITASTGAISITLGTKTAASYTADQISQAVRDKAATIAADSATAAADKAIAENLSSFVMNADSVLTFAAGADAITTGALALVDNGTAKGLTLQIGDTAESFNKLTVSVASMKSNDLGLATVDVSEQEKSANSIKTIKDAINKVSSTRGDLGAMQNRLEHTVNNLSVTNENITNAESRIRDTDMAKEMMAYTSKNILTQAAQSMLAQAHQQPTGRYPTAFADEAIQAALQPIRTIRIQNQGIRAVNRKNSQDGT